MAVFIDDSDDPIRDQMDMASEAYHIFLAEGLLIQPWVFKGSPERPDTRYTVRLLKAVRRDGGRF